MTQRLYAFWKYDRPPHYLGGEVIEMHENGRVSVDGYGGKTFQPAKIVPYEQGVKIQRELEKLENDYTDRITLLNEEIKSSANNLISGKSIAVN